LLVDNINNLVTWEVQYNFALVKQLSTTITSTALISQQVFPNVTEPHFAITGGFTDSMGGIMMALYAPLIPAGKREQWEEYSVQHQDWLEESARLEAENPLGDPLHGTIQDHEHDRRLKLDFNMSNQETMPQGIPTKIWKWDGDEKVVLEANSSQEVFAPLWQSSPAEAGTVNMDLFSDSLMTKLYSSVVQINNPVLSPGFGLGDGNDFDWMFDPKKKPRKQEPHIFIMDRVQTDFGEGKETVGIVVALTSFRDLFTRLIPDGKKGIFCVITGTLACERNMTFLLQGSEAEFVGYDDLHDKGYDEYKHSFPLEMYNATIDDLCLHHVHIYPSTIYKQSFQTNTPV